MGRRQITATLLLFSLATAGCSADAPHRARPSAASAPRVSTSASIASRAPSSSNSTSALSKPKPISKPIPKPIPKPSTPASRQLPLRYPTGNADQVITVTAQSHSSTVATLQAWRRVSGGWRPVGGSVPAHLGSAGIGTTGEGSTKSPTGSYTLTQAFGHDADPGTALPYVRTTPADWWVSESGPLYNTRQRCSTGCSFTRGAPNEHLYYETPYYDYAVVIDYNTRNAPGGVRAGKGSAFFLHVTVGQPTQGCVSVPADQLVRLLRWLTPADHPRILLGVG